MHSYVLRMMTNLLTLKSILEVIPTTTLEKFNLAFKPNNTNITTICLFFLFSYISQKDLNPEVSVIIKRTFCI